MNLKMLLFPTLIILGVYLSIAYIQPDIVSVLSKREEELVKSASLKQVEAIEQNIRSLTQSLNQQPDEEALVGRYFPENIDEERSIDIINFLAQQSGVAVTELDLKENPRITPTTAPSENTGTNADPFATAPTPTTSNTTVMEVPQSYRAQIAVLGPYPNIKNFFDRLYRTDRFRMLTSFSIEEPDMRLQGTEQIIPPDFLEGKTTLNFLYAPLRSAGNAVGQALFQKNTLDLGVAHQLTDFVNSPVGNLAPASPGRGNPFEIIP